MVAALACVRMAGVPGGGGIVLGNGRLNYIVRILMKNDAI